jgi:hypothetical protein
MSTEVRQRLSTTIFVAAALVDPSKKSEEQ